MLSTAILSLGGAMIFLYIGYLKYGSDIQWLVVSLLSTFLALALAAVVCWGGVSILESSGLIGVKQCFSCLDSTESPVTNRTCTDNDHCDPSSWRMIYSLTDCDPLRETGIICSLSTTCYYSAPTTFYYAIVTTVFFLLTINQTAFLVFARLMPSFIFQSTERSQLV